MHNKLRKVVVFTRVKRQDSHLSDLEVDKKGLATFHGWGCDFEDFDDGPGNYSTAIVEREDGRVESVPVTMIQFADTPVEALEARHQWRTLWERPEIDETMFVCAVCTERYLSTGDDFPPVDGCK